MDKTDILDKWVQSNTMNKKSNLLDMRFCCQIGLFHWLQIMQTPINQIINTCRNREVPKSNAETINQKQFSILYNLDR